MEFVVAVYLRGSGKEQHQHKFRHFILSTVNDQLEKEEPSIGTLQLYGDSLTQFSKLCSNAIIETDSQLKSEIQVNWI